MYFYKGVIPNHRKARPDPNLLSSTTMTLVTYFQYLCLQRLSHQEDLIKDRAGRMHDDMVSRTLRVRTNQ